MHAQPGQRPPPPPPGSRPPMQNWQPAPAGPGAVQQQQPGFAPPGPPVPHQYRPVPQQPQHPPQQHQQHQQMLPNQGMRPPVQARPQQLPPVQGPARGMSPPQQQHAQQYPQQYQQQRPPYVPQQHQQQQQQMQPPTQGISSLTQNMGGMNMGQQPGMQSPPPGSHSHKQRTRRAYAPFNPEVGDAPSQGGPAGFPPVNNPQMPGFPGAGQQGYPSPAGPPITGPQTFVPGAQAPAPIPGLAAPYARSPGAAPLPAGTGQPMGQQPAPYEPQKPRIDPNQMPSPITVHTHDQENYGSAQPYSTAQRLNAPLACTEFTAVDDGNSNPRFMRMTMGNVPHTEELLKASHLPLGIIVQPLAELAPSEEPVKLIDFGEEGPIRCLRCKTYINPHMVFINGGKTFVCNMCRHENDVPDDYFCNLDMAGKRLDSEMRPELRNGTVEFVATKDFIARQPAPASFVFAIDVTWNAVQCGMVAYAAAAIKDALYSGSGLPAGVRVGIITYDRSAHFYSLSPSLDQAQMMVVPDIQDMFVPINEGFVVDPTEARHIIEPLLDALPTMFANNRTAEPVLGAVVQAAHEALRGRGGKLIAFQTALPTFGPGSLKQRDDAKLHNTDKERTLYEPQDAFYRDWAIKLVEDGISCSLYLFPSAYVDAATLSQLSTVTGGELYSYPAFEGGRDGRRLMADVRADVQRAYGGSAVLRIRTSDGLRVDEHYGNLYMRNHVDVELAGVTSDSAIGALLQYDGKLDEKQDAYFQAALLYTTSDGQRRIRVHNLAAPCTTLIGNMFRSSEVDTSLNLIAKMAMSEALTSPLKGIREKLTDRCVQILSAYRRNCASGSAPGQLILPEAYKLSPLYNLALLKSPAIRGGADVPIDQRIYHMCLMRQFSVRKTMDYFYPTIAPLHMLAEGEGVADEVTGVVALPKLVRASYSLLDPAGMYMLASGGSLMLWLGRQVSPSLLQAAVGVSALEQIDTKMHSVPEVPTELNQKIRAIAGGLVPTRAGYANVQIVRQGMDQAEVQFASLLVEDRNNDNMTYVDFVCAIHRQIQVEARPKGPSEPKWSYH
ncbi:COPII coat Sec23p-Sfb3p heterodimer component [Coemansia sp. IMI 209128]|nr:COPII coat Sec23p-Sfb3p heterodimer component [Coemansia sp. IMI 209128]